MRKNSSESLENLEQHKNAALLILLTNNFLKNIFSVSRTLNAKGKNMSDIILFGLSANPPATHHIGIVRSLLEVSSKVIIIPSGTRKQKPSTSTTSPKDRKEMVEVEGFCLRV